MEIWQKKDEEEKKIRSQGIDGAGGALA